SGWLVGTGIEWAFLPNWSAKVEYNYLGLGDRTFTVPAGSPFLASDTFTQSNRSIPMARVGISYLFNSYYCVPADPACAQLSLPGVKWPAPPRPPPRPLEKRLPRPIAPIFGVAPGHQATARDVWSGARIWTRNMEIGHVKRG